MMMCISRSIWLRITPMERRRRKRRRRSFKWGKKSSMEPTERCLAVWSSLVTRVGLGLTKLYTHWLTDCVSSSISLPPYAKVRQHCCSQLSLNYWLKMMKTTIPTDYRYRASKSGQVWNVFVFNAFLSIQFLSISTELLWLYIYVRCDAMEMWIAEAMLELCRVWSFQIGFFALLCW